MGEHHLVEFLIAVVLLFPVLVWSEIWAPSQRHYWRSPDDGTKELRHGYLDGQHLPLFSPFLRIHGLLQRLAESMERLATGPPEKIKKEKS